MNKSMKLIASAIFVIFVLTNFCFAKEMVKAKDTYYLIDDDSSICKNEPFFDGKETYYFGADGMMSVGWTKNIKNNKTYFFDNTYSDKRGAMIVGSHVIDGFTMFFETNADREIGSLIISMEQFQAPDGNVYRIDQNGFAYDKKGNVLRDTTKGHRSEFYSDESFYLNPDLDNAMFAGVNTDAGRLVKPSMIRERLLNKGNKDLIISGKIE